MYPHKFIGGALTPTVTVCGVRAYKKVIQIKWGLRVKPLFSRTGVLSVFEAERKFYLNTQQGRSGPESGYTKAKDWCS